MKIYRHRFDKTYQQRLTECFSIDNIINSPIEFSKPIDRAGSKYNKLCRIDYIGLSGTSFLDIACNYIKKDDVPKKFTELLENVNVLNDQGIFLKIRLLLMYPYSTSFLSIIQAESSTHRGAVDSPGFLRDFSIVDQVDEQTFFSSASIRNQKNCLKHLQELMSRYILKEGSPNRVRVRFTPINVNFSLLVINNHLFYTPYIFAKNKRLKEQLALKAPVVEIDMKSDKSIFDQFDDHFRYLWDLDTTIFCEDATKYELKRSDSLSDINPPSRISFDAKASKIREYIKEQTGREISDDDIRKWKLCLQHTLQRYTTDTRPSPSIESLFIACSWETGSDNKSMPNKYAKKLLEWIEKDFGGSSNNPILSVHVLEAAIGESLAQQVYSRLREATLAIIILSRDIESKDGSYYTKPNVLHELGYLMHQLDSRRLIVLREENVIVPSNINDKVFISFDTDKLSLCYREIVLWLNNVSSLTCSSSIRESLKSHRKRLEEFIINEELEQSEGKEGCRKISEDLKWLTNHCT